jgi:carboxypeptidase PM20D1
MLSGGVAPNVLPASAEAAVNIRLMPGDDTESLVAWIKALVRDLGVMAEVVFEQPATEPSNYQGAAFQKLSEAVRDVFPGIPAVPGLYCGAADARYYTALSDTVIRFSPFIVTSAELAAVHAENERVAIASLGAAVQFYRVLIERFCSFEEEKGGDKQ